MAHTSAFCREQQAQQRLRAADTDLENVRIIATNAAAAWGREGVLAESREVRNIRDARLPEAASQDEEDDDQLFSENPDRGLG